MAAKPPPKPKKPPPIKTRPAQRAGILFVVVVMTWSAVAFWNSVKPMPPGTHVASLPTRLAESQIDFIDEKPLPGVMTRRGGTLVDRAEQMIVLEECPLPNELAEHLLVRKRQRPNLKIVLLTDPRSEIYGGTPTAILSSLEQAGIIVARTGLDRLRDSNPLYSSMWRLGAGWWSDPFDEGQGQATLMSSLRHANAKSDERRVLVADDGAGGWSSIVASSDRVALELRGHLAREIAASELRIAAWSTDDDRLPAPPPADNRSMGSIDARFLSEGAILAALRDALSVAASGDSISIAVGALGERQIIAALLRAAARGAHLQLLLDPLLPANLSVAAELMRHAGTNVEVRWQSSTKARLMVVRHRTDVWLNVGSADLSRRDLDDLNLEANVELHMPARAAPARAAADTFAREWSTAAPYADHVDESADAYWRYRIAEATGLSMSF